MNPQAHYYTSNQYRTAGNLSYDIAQTAVKESSFNKTEKELQLCLTLSFELNTSAVAPWQWTVILWLVSQGLNMNPVHRKRNNRCVAGWHTVPTESQRQPNHRSKFRGETRRASNATSIYTNQWPPPQSNCQWSKLWFQLQNGCICIWLEVGELDQT